MSFGFSNYVFCCLTRCALKLLVYFWIHIPNKEGKCSGFIFEFKALKNTNDVS